MKTLLFSLALLLSSTCFTTAQDFYLPSSSKSKKAVATLHQAAELYGNVHFAQGNEKTAEALAEDPNLFLAHVNAVQFASKAEKPAIIEKALAVDATNFNEAEKIMRGVMEKWAQDLDYAPTEEMKSLVAAYPKTPQATEWASLHAFFTAKDADAGLAYAQKLAKMSPKYGPNYNTMGYMYLKKGEMDKAKAALEKYIATTPKKPNAYDSMGEYYMNAKDYAKSVEYYDKAAKLGLADAKERADKAREMMKQK